MELSFNDLSTHARNVWNASSIAEKKQAADLLIEQMRYKSKAVQFRQKLSKLNCPKQLDSFAANILLVDSDKVIR